MSVFLTHLQKTGCANFVPPSTMFASWLSENYGHWQHHLEFQRFSLADYTEIVVDGQYCNFGLSTQDVIMSNNHDRFVSSQLLVFGGTVGGYPLAIDTRDPGDEIGILPFAAWEELDDLRSHWESLNQSLETIVPWVLAGGLRAREGF